MQRIDQPRGSQRSEKHTTRYTYENEYRITVLDHLALTLTVDDFRGLKVPIPC